MVPSPRGTLFACLVSWKKLSYSLGEFALLDMAQTVNEIDKHQHHAPPISSTRHGPARLQLSACLMSPQTRPTMRSSWTVWHSTEVKTLRFLEMPIAEKEGCKGYKATEC